MRIGLFGGSFNPVHNGHVALGRAMLAQMHLDEVWYMVSPQNPLKQGADDLAPEEARLHLVDIALGEYPQLKASDYEFCLPRPSYTWDTLQHLQRDYPQHRFVLIIGGDNWACFDRWAHHEDILREYEIAIYPREGVYINKEELPEKVHQVNVPLVNVTSTMLREMIRKGEDITAYVPEKVAEELRRVHLY